MAELLTRQVLYSEREDGVSCRRSHKHVDLGKGRETYQQPVLDRGGNRMRGGAIRPFSGFPVTSSLGAIMGSRSERLPVAWPRRFCITTLVAVIRLTGCLCCGEVNPVDADGIVTPTLGRG